MAPEVYAYDRYSEQCDTFSWSIVVWQLICKQATPYSPANLSIAWSVFNDKLRPNKIEPCPEIFKALLYRSWHSNPNERPSLTFIKTVLDMILKVLPKTKTQEISIERRDQLKQQWTVEFKLPDKYLPMEPRSSNQESMNIYQNHLKVMENVIEIEKKRRQTNENLKKFTEYDRLLEENKELKRKIEELRRQT